MARRALTSSTASLAPARTVSRAPSVRRTSTSALVHRVSTELLVRTRSMATRVSVLLASLVPTVRPMWMSAPATLARYDDHQLCLAITPKIGNWAHYLVHRNQCNQPTKVDYAPTFGLPTTTDKRVSVLSTQYSVRKASMGQRRGANRESNVSRLIMLLVWRLFFQFALFLARRFVCGRCQLVHLHLRRRLYRSPL